MVWLQTEDAVTSPVYSPGSAACPTPSQSQSAVGVYLERLSVAPTPATTAPVGGVPARSPTRRGVDGSGSFSPRARGSVSTPVERQQVSKDIDLGGLVAYTKESTADWMVTSPGDGDSGGDSGSGSDSDSHDAGGGGGGVRARARLRPTLPIEKGAATAAASATDAAADAEMDAAATAGSVDTSAEPISGGGDVGQIGDGEWRENLSVGAGFAATCEPVFILRPLQVTGTLVIQEGGTVQAAHVSTAEAGGRSGMGGPDAADGSGVSDAESNEPPPLASVFLSVEAVVLQLDTRQYAVLNSAVSALTMSQRRFRFRSMRPTTPVLEDTWAWWRYAIRYARVKRNKRSLTSRRFFSLDRERVV